MTGRVYVCPSGHRTPVTVGTPPVTATTTSRSRTWMELRPEVIRCPERIAARTTCGMRAVLQQEEPAPRMPGREPS